MWLRSYTFPRGALSWSIQRLLLCAVLRVGFLHVRNAWLLVIYYRKFSHLCSLNNFYHRDASLLPPPRTIIGNSLPMWEFTGTCWKGLICEHLLMNTTHLCLLWICFPAPLIFCLLEAPFHWDNPFPDVKLKCRYISLKAFWNRPLRAKDKEANRK